LAVNQNLHETSLALTFATTSRLAGAFFFLRRPTRASGVRVSSLVPRFNGERFT
jgi:hypothetical protein